MTSDIANHPGPDLLWAFSCGRLDPDSATSVEQHLATCDDCCKLLEADSDSSFLDRLRSARQQLQSDSSAEPGQLNSAKGSPAVETVTFSGAPTREIQKDLEVPRGWENHPGYRIEQRIEAGGMGVV
jgi:anti-sigma factor RsiW